MFELNTKEVLEFKEIWQNQTGELLSDAKAQELGLQLVNQLSILYGI